MRPRSSASWLPILAGLMLLLPQEGVAARLDQDARDGYRLWLHNLETTREHQQVGPATPAFPFGLLDDVADVRVDSLSLLVVAREMEELESRPRILQEPAEKSALHSLVRARNHRNLAEFDTALAWYRETARRDSSEAFVHELGPEALAVAAAASDSAAVARHLARVIASARPAAHAAELVLGYRYLIAHADTLGIDRLAAAVAADPEGVSGDLAFWHAFALGQRGRWDESLGWLCGLVTDTDRSHGLTVRQRAWVLAAIPDQLVLTGHVAEAAPLYRALAAADLPGASDWARCQAAVIDLLAGRYLEAATVFEDLCERREAHAWRAYACDMSQISEELERLRNEGTAHGAASHYDH